jgi:drug/metabolite transporter (DMT)-like permease
MAERSPDRTTLLAFAGAVLIGGSNFVAVSFSNDELEPQFGAALRFTVAAFIFIALMRIQKLPLPPRREALGAAIYGLLGFGVSYAFLYYALVGLTAGTASVMVAATPLVTLVLAVLHRQERFTTGGLIGGVLAMAGIAVLSLDSLGGNLRPTYLVASLLGVIAVGESSVIIKGFPRAHPITTNAIGMSVGAVFLVISSVAFGESWIVPQDARTWVSLGWLIVAGSVGLFVLFLYVIQRWTASATVYALTLMPVVAVTLGALLADEEITIELILGGALVMAAVYVGALSGPR